MASKLAVGVYRLTRSLQHDQCAIWASLVCRQHAPRRMSVYSSPQTTNTEQTLKCIGSAVGPLSREPMVLPQRPVVLLVSGPSGVGKDSIVNRLLQLRPDLHFVVTATSRPMRPGERDGVDYQFVDKAQFERWIANGDLLEHALVYGEYKGIPRTQITAALQRGADVVLRLDVQGAATVRKFMPDAVSVFIVAQTEEELVHRLVQRKTESAEALVARVSTIKAELGKMHEFEYVVVNAEGGVDGAARQLCAIIDATKCRTARLKTAQP